jgi:hypothetical protein
LFAIVGFLWYPMKRFLINRKRKEAKSSSTEDESEMKE